MAARTPPIKRQFDNSAGLPIDARAEREDAEIRRRLVEVRDALLLLAFQAAVRATEAMRNLNY